LAGFGAVRLEIGVEVPDQLAHVLLCSTVQIGEGVQLVHQPFGMCQLKCFRDAFPVFRLPEPRNENEDMQRRRE